MKQIIINADDFGFSAGINKGIIQSYKKGLTTSTSIVCNTANFEKSARALKKLGDIGKGIHLNISLGKPVLNQKDIGSLVNKNGCFEKNAYKLILNIILARVSKEHIKDEFEAQINKVLAKFGSISHIDCHEHIHALPLVYPIVLKLARKYHIPFVRIPKQNLLINPLNNLVEKKVLYGWSLIDSLYGKNDYRTKIRNFYGVYNGGLNVSLLGDIINHFREGVGEIVCHPAYPDAFIRANWAKLEKEKLNDLNTLVNPLSKRIMKENGVKLIRFEDLIK